MEALALVAASGVYGLLLRGSNHTIWQRLLDSGAPRSQRLQDSGAPHSQRLQDSGAPRSRRLLDSGAPRIVVINVPFALHSTMAQRPKIQLRRYLRDSRAPVPRTTLWRHRKRAAQHGAGPAREVTLPRPSISVPKPPPPLSDPGSPPPPHSDRGSPLSSPSDRGSPPPSPSDRGSPLSSPSDRGSPPPSPSDRGSPPPSPSDRGSPPPSPSDRGSPQDPAPSPDEIPPLTVQDSPELFEPLYAGAQISLCGAMCAIMHFCSMHSLSYSAIKDLLQLVLLLCPGPNKLPSSLYHFQKFFFKYQSKKTSTRVCSDCYTPLSDCICSLPRRTSPAHLITVSILKPLQAIIFRECG